MKSQFNRDEGFIVQLLFYGFYFLEKVTPYSLVKTFFNKRWLNKHKKQILDEQECRKLQSPLTRSYIMPELWAIGHFLTALLVAKLLENQLVPQPMVLWFIIFFSMWRLFELFVYQVNVLFFHRLIPKMVVKKETDETRLWTLFDNSRSIDRSDAYTIKSSTRTVILLLINMWEYVYQFAVIYAVISLMNNAPEGLKIAANSFELFMNISGSDGLQTRILILVYIAKVEMALGLFMNLVCLSRFIGMLPSVKSSGAK